ncbi:MAG: hypothetical protein IJO01_01185 [Oscillospiraceae bacterium]|nr:hypothetical protein [Oscillospiraceae bacterium]
MKKIFSVFLIIALLLCGCQAVPEDAAGKTCDVRPMIYYEGIYWVNPHMPVSDLPEGYEYAGTVDEEMAYNTGLEGTEYYTNPESNDFYTYQKTGTPIGGNTVDTTKMAMHYVQWVPIDN